MTRCCVLLVALLTALSPACGRAVYSRIVSSAGQPRVRTAQRPASDDWDKSRVLAELGPPAQTLPLLDGDVFVYRLRNVDQRILQLETGSFGGVDLLLYSEFEGWRTDLTLFCFFDRTGKLRDVASSNGRNG